MSWRGPLGFNPQVCRWEKPLLRSFEDDGGNAQRGQGNGEGVLERDGNVGHVGRAGAVPYAARSQVRFPEPRGPNRKKLCLGGVRMRLNSVVWFAVILRRFLTA